MEKWKKWVARLLGPVLFSALFFADGRALAQPVQSQETTRLFCYAQDGARVALQGDGAQSRSENQPGESKADQGQPDQSQSAERQLDENQPSQNQSQSQSQSNSLQSGQPQPSQGLHKALHAQSAVLLDGDTGRVLYGKEEEQVRPMASTTKIMTCILALEYGNLKDEVKVSSNAARQPKVRLGASAGQGFYLKDLLYSLMLESHNDSAVMIAEHIGGSVEGFAALMNRKARGLGCQNTCFITPNGLDASAAAQDGKTLTHSTTAKDLALIMRYCVWQSPQKEKFLEITQTQNYYFLDAKGKHGYSCVNHNALLSMMDGVLSGKTGFTGGAGYSYVAALDDDGRHFVLALLGCGWPPHKTYKWSDARALFSYGKENYEKREVFEEPDFAPVLVENGIPQGESLGSPAYVGLSMDLRGEEKSLKVLMREDERIRVEMALPASLKAPVKQGEAVGYVDYFLGAARIKRYPVYAKNTVEPISLGWCLEKMGKVFLLR